MDTSFGGAGNDRMFAVVLADVDTSNGPDTTGDTLDAGPGNDRIVTRDGETDTVTCGEGERDRALLDAVDVIADATADDPLGSCERVVRAEPTRGIDDEEQATQDPPEDDDKG